ncbi:Fic family protein [Capnocytophaga canis]|uniref:Fic family protein n=1 Tax=Capnocytophaga canis TaxID=1848903 RepID=UPI001561B5FB|nr:Fic family protein [Capnocytophaga canis]
MNTIFNEIQKEKAQIILENNDLMPFKELFSTEIKQLAILWAYYSGKIEGNTYNYVETETLLKDGITSPRRYEDAKELKNLYNTFISEVEYIKKGNKEVIDEKLIFRLHSSLMQDLISDEERGVLRWRAVSIHGSDYTPTQNRQEIQQRFSEILYLQENIKNPIEKAVFVHCNMAKLQPFIDGNKRTSRLLESIILMNENIVPVFSKEEKDINEYRKSLLSFYEKGDYSKYADYILDKKMEYLQQFTKKKLIGNILKR